MALPPWRLGMPGSGPLPAAPDPADRMSAQPGRQQRWQSGNSRTGAPWKQNDRQTGSSSESSTLIQDLESWGHSLLPPWGRPHTAGDAADRMHANSNSVPPPWQRGSCDAVSDGPGPPWQSRAVCGSASHQTEPPHHNKEPVHAGACERSSVNEGLLGQHPRRGQELRAFVRNRRGGRGDEADGSGFLEREDGGTYRERRGGRGQAVSSWEDCESQNPRENHRAREAYPEGGRRKRQEAWGPSDNWGGKRPRGLDRAGDGEPRIEPARRGQIYGGSHGRRSPSLESQIGGRRSVEQQSPERQSLGRISPGRRSREKRSLGRRPHPSFSRPVSHCSRGRNRCAFSRDVRDPPVSSTSLSAVAPYADRAQTGNPGLNGSHGGAGFAPSPSASLPAPLVGIPGGTSPAGTVWPAAAPGGGASGGLISSMPSAAGQAPFPASGVFEHSSTPRGDPPGNPPSCSFLIPPNQLAVAMVPAAGPPRTAAVAFPSALPACFWAFPPTGAPFPLGDPGGVVPVADVSQSRFKEGEPSPRVRRGEGEALVDTARGFKGRPGDGRRSLSFSPRRYCDRAPHSQEPREQRDGSRRERPGRRGRGQGRRVSGSWLKRWENRASSSSLAFREALPGREERRVSRDRRRSSDSHHSFGGPCGGRYEGQSRGVARGAGCFVRDRDESRCDRPGYPRGADDSEKHASFYCRALGRGCEDFRGLSPDYRRANRGDRKPGRSDGEDERGRGEEQIPWYARSSRHGPLSRPSVGPRLLQPAPQFSTQIPVLREAAKEAIRSVFRRFATCIEAVMDSGSHGKSGNASAAVKAAEVGGAGKPTVEKCRDAGSGFEVSKKEEEGRAEDADASQGQGDERNQSSSREGDEVGGLREPLKLNSEEGEARDFANESDKAVTNSGLHTDAGKPLDSSEQEAGPKDPGNRQEDQNMQKTEAEKTTEPPRESGPLETVKAVERHVRSGRDPPKLALLITSLPNIRLAPLHRMITAHYRIHDAVSFLLLLASCPSTGRCRGFGVILASTSACAEKILRAPLFTWRAAGGDGRPGGCLIPPRFSSRHSSSFSTACSLCLPPRASSSSSTSRVRPGTSPEGRISLACPGARRDARWQLDSSDRSSLSRSASLHAGKRGVRSPPVRSFSRAGEVAMWSDPRWRDGSTRGEARLSAGGREKAHVSGGGGRGVEFERKKQPLCDRAVKLHALVSPTLQFQFNARVAQLVTQSTWSRSFFSSLWTQLFKCLFVPPFALSLTSAACASKRTCFEASSETSFSTGEDKNSLHRLSEETSVQGDGCVPERSIGGENALRSASFQHDRLTVSRPPLSLQCQSLEQECLSAAAVAALLHTGVYMTSKRIYVHLPQAALRRLFSQEAGRSLDPRLAPGKPRASASQRKECDEDSGRSEEKSGDMEMGNADSSETTAVFPPLVALEAAEGLAVPVPVKRCGETEHTLIDVEVEGSGSRGENEVKRGASEVADREEERNAVVTEPIGSSTACTNGGDEHDSSCGVRRLRGEAAFAANVFEMIRQDRRAPSFTISDEDGAHYSIQSLANLTDNWFPWDVKSVTHLESRSEVSDAVANALDALFRSLVEEQMYPVEYLAFEGVHFGNAWLTPPRLRPAVTLSVASPADDPSREIGQNKPLRWGENIEKVVLPHALLVRGLPNTPAEGTQQSLEKMLLELWGPWLLSHAGAAGSEDHRTSSDVPSDVVSSSTRSSSFLRPRKATDTLDQELWGWQLFDFLETRMLRGDGFLLLPSCLPAATALKLLAVCSLPQTEEGPDSPATSPFLEAKRHGESSGSSEELSPLLLPLTFRAPSPSAPHVFSVLPFEVSSHLKVRDLSFLASLINSVLCHLLHRCVSSACCCCSQIQDATGPLGRRRCCCCVPCRIDKLSFSTGQEGEGASDEQVSLESFKSLVSSKPVSGDLTREGNHEVDFSIPHSSSSNCDEPSCSTSSSELPVTSCSCCCCVEETRDPTSEASTASGRRPHRKQRRIPLGTAQVARGWVASLPPFQVRPGLPFAMPHAPLITTKGRRQRLNGDAADEEGRLNEDPVLPPPACGAEHLIESLFFSVEAFFQQSFLQPFFSLRTEEECRVSSVAVNEEEAFACVDDSGEDSDSVTGDEEEGEMEDEEETNDVWHLQKRENRWRRIGAETLGVLADREDRGARSLWRHLGLTGSLPEQVCGQTELDVCSSSQTCLSNSKGQPRPMGGEPQSLRKDGESVLKGAVLEAGGGREENVGRMKTERVADQPDAFVEGDCSEVVGEKDELHAEGRGNGSVANQYEVSVKKETEGETRLSLSRDDDKESAPMSLDSGRSNLLSSASPADRLDAREGREAKEKTVHKKKKLLVRLDARPSLDDAHSTRVTPETLVSLEAEGKFRFLPLSILFFTPNFRSNFDQGFFPAHYHPEPPVSSQAAACRAPFSPACNQSQVADPSGSPGRFSSKDNRNRSATHAGMDVEVSSSPNGSVAALKRMKLPERRNESL
ncbi:hypothetical protein TGME49_265090 [Toxoplasma gondii ME49]|uniref:Uncharacterized protein n=3 Tax=Toxoplasma gondii TaxID=5811 RepID=S8F2J8_TOXGM|nr:hypothetical protein TGME49_265090 [Toxoplasma gondii ME49]EPT27753.1 hypothetical protein TGME49_265090 [Toxoplasma gondii ME49]|eukprot:XP_018636311.1 hypothetical protein TGME49_265090 [Toxoplasma gondii ME49]